jgi:hypothetical protein
MDQSKRCRGLRERGRSSSPGESECALRTGARLARGPSVTGPAALGCVRRGAVVAGLLLFSPTIGWAQDADGDGVPNATDEFPCDGTRASVSFFPTETSSALLAFEDQWPGATDLDFNDVALRVNFRIERNAAGNAVRVLALLDPPSTRRG